MNVHDELVTKYQQRGTPLLTGQSDAGPPIHVISQAQAPPLDA